jgi:hypothetical protein
LSAEVAEPRFILDSISSHLRKSLDQIKTNANPAENLSRAMTTLLISTNQKWVSKLPMAEAYGLSPSQNQEWHSQLILDHERRTEERVYWHSPIGNLDRIRMDIGIIALSILMLRSPSSLLPIINDMGFPVEGFLMIPQTGSLIL